LENQRIVKNQLLTRLPDEWPQDLRPAIQKQVIADRRKIVVLDDDPTGTQTIHGLPVITEWSVDTLAAELKNELPGVPVWKLGAESRFPNLAYIVFPGNVGDNHALVDVARQLKANFGKKA
jgi:uncharacterized protein YgbK (DUF1537 family)